MKNGRRFLCPVAGLLLVVVSACQSAEERDREAAWASQIMMQRMFYRDFLRRMESQIEAGRCRTAADSLLTHRRSDVEAPTELRSRVLRANALACLEEHDEGIAILDRLLADDYLMSRAATDQTAMRSIIMANRAMFQFHARDLIRALESANAAIELAPTLPNGHFWLASTLDGLGYETQAIEAYRAVLRHSTAGQRNPSWVAHAEERIRALEGSPGP